MSLSTSLGGIALALSQSTTAPSHQVAFPVADEDGVRPYPQLTETRRSVTNFNVEVFRGLVFAPDGQHFYALSATASLLERFVPPLPDPVDVWPTVHQPVALAWHEGNVLVLGGATHALVRHSRTDGRILDALSVPSEPADLVVDEESDTAWVSCQGADVVVEVDLATFTEVRRYELGVKRPGFLWLDPGLPFVDDTLVYVTPMISGNNTLVRGNQNGAQILDGTKPALFPGGGLPDVDLLRIDPRAPLASAVTHAWRGAGSILLAHGENPVTGQHWVLGVDEDNADPQKADEPSLRGRFATNVLAIGPQPAAAGAPLQPAIVDLDDSDPAAPGGQYDPAVRPPAAFPYGLTFTSSGFALVAASTSDRVVLLDPEGARLREFELPAGSIPRQVVLLPGEQAFGVYCQGTNRIEVFGLLPPSQAPIASFDLGHDPLPAAVRAGRAIWYDAGRSENERLSCNTCHPRGGSDGIGWELSDPPLDYKDAMVTQSLFGIEDTFPYHWRGERDLRAFNGAFVALLGAAASLDEAPGSELDRFVEFVFSLQQPANPIASLRRRVEDAVADQVRPNGLVGHATDAVDDYLFFSSQACNDCHALPTGSLGDIRPQPVFPSPISSEASTEIPHFENLTLRHQPLVDVAMAQGTIQAPLLGFGFAHDGVRLSAFHFVDTINQLSDQQVADMAAFLEQYDHGIAPAAHAAVRLDDEDWYAARARVRDVLIPQAERRWIDLCAFGTTRGPGGALVDVGWVWDVGVDRFLSYDPAIGARTLDELVQEARDGDGTTLFLGVPPGNGFRLGVDRDHDELPTAVEVALGTDPFDPDTDGDGDPDGYEVRNPGDPLDADTPADDTKVPGLVDGVELSFANARQAKFFVHTTEPVRLEASYQTAGGPPHTTAGLVYDTVHTLLLRDLEPSSAGLKTNTFTGQLGLVDRAGNRKDLPLPAFASASMFLNATTNHSVIGDLSVASAVPAGPDALDVVLDVRVDHKEGGPPALPFADRVVVLQISKRDPQTGVLAVSSDTQSALPTSFEMQGAPYQGLPGPFLVAAPTDATGRTTIAFTETALVAGQEIVCNVVAVLAVPDPNTYDPNAPAFGGIKELQEYQMPATPAAQRRITLTF